MLLVFEFARLVPFVAPNVAGFFPANPQSTFRIHKVKLVEKCQKKKLPAAPKFIYDSKLKFYMMHIIFSIKVL